MKLLNTAICLLLFVVQLQTASAQTFVYDVDISEVSFFEGLQYHVFGTLEVNLDTDQIINSSLQFQNGTGTPIDLPLTTSQNSPGVIDFFDDAGELFFVAPPSGQTNGSRFIWTGDETFLRIDGATSTTPNGTFELCTATPLFPYSGDCATLDSLSVKLGQRSFDLNVRGTEGPDNIFVTQVGQQLEVRVNGALDGVYNLENVDLVEIFGLGGNDTIEVNASVRTFISGGFGADEISGGRLENEIQGGPGPDTIFGGPMADTINGGFGTDSINALGGDDIIIGGSADDFLMGGGGNDTIRGSLGADAIFGGPGDDVLYGNAGADSIFGGGGDDSLIGQGGPDDLDGGPGMDDLSGGEGFDMLDGGSGIDTAVDQGEVEVGIELEQLCAAINFNSKVVFCILFLQQRLQQV